MGSAEKKPWPKNTSKVSFGVTVFHPYKWSYGPLLVTVFLYPLRRECATYFSIVAGQRPKHVDKKSRVTCSCGELLFSLRMMDECFLGIPQIQLVVDWWFLES